MKLERLERRSPEDILTVIYERLQDNEDHTLTVNRLAIKTGADYKVVEKWVRLIEKIQKMPVITMLKSEKPMIVRMEERQRSAKDIGMGARRTWPVPDEKSMLLWQLLKKGATTKKSAVDLEVTATVKELLGNKAICRHQGKVYLTGNGILIAEGIRDIYGDV